MKIIIFSLSLLVFLLLPRQGFVFAEEIYQDENGVWTNRPQLGIVDTVEKGATALGQGASEATGAAILGLGQVLADPSQKALESMAKDARARVEKSEYEQAEKKRIVEEKKRVIDPLSYERFDTSTAGEVKSEWEFFEDPR
jgi:hypothetical protein